MGEMITWKLRRTGSLEHFAKAVVEDLRSPQCQRALISGSS